MTHEEFTRLQGGDLIETTGFLSTSKNLEKALKFCDPHSKEKIVFKIRIPLMKFSEESMKYDGGGFVDMQKVFGEDEDEDVYREEEVLFNPLNIFQVSSVKKMCLTENN